MVRIGMTFSRYVFVLYFYVLRVPLPAHDVFNIILHFFTDFFDICN